MGTSSSQVRLLALTSKIHDVEFKAQNIMSKKVQLATQQDEVYQDYLKSLDAKKVQVAFNNGSNGKAFLDATFSNVCTYNEARYQQYSLKDVKSGKLVLPENVCNAYKANRNDKFNFAWECMGYPDGININELNKTQNAGLPTNTMSDYLTDSEYLTLVDKIGTEYTLDELAQQYKNGTLNCLDRSQIETEVKANSEIKNLAQDLGFASVDDYIDFINNINDNFLNHLDGYNNIDWNEYLQSAASRNGINSANSYLRSIGFVFEEDYIDFIKHFAEYPEIDWDKDKNGIMNDLGFTNIQDLYDYLGFDNQYGNYYYYEFERHVKNSNFNWKAEMENIAQARGFDSVNEYSDFVYYNYYYKNCNGNFNGHKSTLDRVIKNTIESQLNTKNDKNLRVVYEKYMGAANNEEKAQYATQIKETLYSKYPNDIYSYMKGNLNGTDEYNENEFQYYVRLWENINESGGCMEVPVAADCGDESNKWFNDILSSGRAIICSYNETTKGWDELTVSNTVNNNYLIETDDTTNQKRAEAEYEYNLKILKDKDSKFDKELSKLDTEKNAIEKEMETIKTVIKDNIDKTYNSFS